MQNNFGNFSARMDSPYLNAPALLGLAQHPAGFTEALRLSRALNTQAAEAKEFPTPFSAASFGARAAFDFSAIAGSPLFMSSPFMTSAAVAALGSLDHQRLPFPPTAVSSPSSGAFHPPSSISHTVPASLNDHKLFSIPVSMATKQSPLDKISASGVDGHVTSSVAHQQLLRAASGVSGGGGGLRNFSECEEEEEVLTASSLSERGSSPEDVHLRRKVSSGDLGTCPVCGQRLNPGQLTEHLRVELERMQSPASLCRRLSPERQFIAVPVTTEAFQRVRANRQLRLRCLSRKRRISNEYELGEDASGEEEGRQSVQPSDLSPSARRQQAPPAKKRAAVHQCSSHVTSASPASSFDRQVALSAEDEDVDIVGDSDNHIGDLWPRTKLNTSQSASGANSVYEEGVPDTTMEKHSTAEIASSAGGEEQLQLLRQRLQQLEGEAARCRCSICSLPLSNPRVSTQCWHVHCQHCWLQTLKTSNRCPQCQAEMSTEDLKTVYV